MGRLMYAVAAGGAPATFTSARLYRSTTATRDAVASAVATGKLTGGVTLRYGIVDDAVAEYVDPEETAIYAVPLVDFTTARWAADKLAAAVAWDDWLMTAASGRRVAAAQWAADRADIIRPVGVARWALTARGAVRLVWERRS